MVTETNTNAKNTPGAYIPNRRQMTGGNCLFLIDPQVDFVDNNAPLKVDGAKEDCQKIHDFIKKHGLELNEIYVTLDSHQKYHIAHPSFWKNGKGEHPKPFTQIPHLAVKPGEGKQPVWETSDTKMQEWAEYYTEKLEKKKKILTIWPEHCRIGTPGHNVEYHVRTALDNWEKQTRRTVHYTMKGNNSKTEHYSAFKAEVEVEEDPATKFNEELYKALTAHKKIYIAGEALS